MVQKYSNFAINHGLRRFPIRVVPRPMVKTSRPVPISIATKKSGVVIVGITLPTVVNVYCEVAPVV